MKKKAAVGELMSRHVYTVAPTDELRVVLDILQEHGVRHIPVVSDDQVVGIISQRDIDQIIEVEAVEKNQSISHIMKELKAGQVMTKQVLTIDQAASVEEVSALFAQKNIHALPVTDGQELQGIITHTDIINHLLNPS